MASITRPLVVLLFLVVASSSARADNDGLTKAREHIDKVELAEAKRVLDATLKAGGLSATDLATVYQLLGEVSVGVGQPEQAREYFKHLLVLEPDFAFGNMTSPKIVAELDAVKQSPPGALEATADLVGRAVVLTVSADPLSMVKGVRVTFSKADGSAGEVEAKGSDRIEVPMPTEGATEIVALAVDEHGNALRSYEVGTLEAVVAGGGGGGGGGGGTEGPGGTPVYQQWWLWAGVVGVLGATGGFFAWRTKVAQDDLDDIIANSDEHFFSEAQDAEDRGKRNALLANISFAAAGAAAVTGAILVIMGRGKASKEQEEPGMVIAPTAGPDTVGAAVRWTF